MSNDPLFHLTKNGLLKSPLTPIQMKCWAPREYAKECNWSILIPPFVVFLLIFQFDCLSNFLHVYICPFHFGLIYQDDLQLANQFKLKNVYFCLTSIFLTLLLLRYKTINIYCHFPFAIRSQVFAKSCTLFMRLFTSQVFLAKKALQLMKAAKKYKLIICMTQFVP